MTKADRLVIWWHAACGHESAFTPNGKTWLCACGAIRGRSLRRHGIGPGGV